MDDIIRGGRYVYNRLIYRLSHDRHFDPFYTGPDKFLRREKLARIRFQFTRDSRTVQVLKR